ncbi:uncharacterized protein BBOV_IV008820 [Babesia bovis T2Bo]|uniref:C3H1-type domain-containing protein n=1 Tax=Babesia bovis TaxID=5865 RepID=A7ARR7_BABBO|nr:uncharacterized protein BBOV_IV008820 [Babesia bovis T2Bo]EDO07236.1 hypothetical protein BBOV_IV008820 [Babesia bovis T2Bo]|eukprot:XP_001610804.1 hypothetical protein [Babesia bovis T2Bo]
MVFSIPVTRSYDPTRAYPYLTKKFKRRDPNMHFYIPVECPYLKRCTDGYCPLSHTKLEIMFHPMVYKSRRCKMARSGSCRFSWHCTFYDNESEKLAAHLLWLLWERTWDLWRSNIKFILNAHRKLCYRTINIVSLVANNRGDLGLCVAMLSSSTKELSFRNAEIERLFCNQISTLYNTGESICGFNPDIALLCSSNNPFLTSCYTPKPSLEVFYEWFFTQDVKSSERPEVLEIK